MAAVSAVTDATFAQEVLASSKPVLVDYWADWCAPCKQLAPILDELAASHGEAITFCKIDTNENPVTPASYGVMGLPTLHLFVNGEIVVSLTGSKSKAAILKALDPHL